MAALRCKMVRDLWWVGSTPALNFPDGDSQSQNKQKESQSDHKETQSDQKESSACASTHSCNKDDNTGLAFLRPPSQKRDVDGEWKWVCSLDSDPTQPLKAWLVERQKSKYDSPRFQRRSLVVGVYFALLLEYWCRFCPVYGRGPALQSKHSSRCREVFSGLQVRCKSIGQTLGALKLVIAREWPACEPPTTSSAKTQTVTVDDHQKTDMIHLEGSVKFFCYDPQRHPTSMPHAPMDAVLGADLGESMATRMCLGRRKMALLDLVRDWWKRQFGGRRVYSRFLLKGLLFLPVEAVGAGGDTLVRLRERMPTELNGRHCVVGWWTTRSTDGQSGRVFVEYVNGLL